MRVVGNVIGWSASCFYRSTKAINYITLSVKPEIGNKVNDFHFVFNGADVTGPIINRRSLHSNVLIKSGDTLALGGLILDQVSKSHTKVPVLGDIPVLGYAFQRTTTRDTTQSPNLCYAKRRLAASTGGPSNVGLRGGAAPKRSRPL